MNYRSTSNTTHLIDESDRKLTYERLWWAPCRFPFKTDGLDPPPAYYSVSTQPTTVGYFCNVLSEESCLTKMMPFFLGSPYPVTEQCDVIKAQSHPLTILISDLTTGSAKTLVDMPGRPAAWMPNLASFLFLSSMGTPKA